MDERLAERPVRGLLLAERYFFERSLDVDRGRHQMVSAKRGSDERKTASPQRKRTAATADPDRDLPRLGRAASSTAQRQPPITVVIGLSERIHCHFSGI